MARCAVQEEELRRHLKEHYSAMFKCSVCHLGFEGLGAAGRHLARRHGAAGGEVLWPAGGRLLSAR